MHSIRNRDISTFTQLKVCRILYRQHFKSQLDMNAIFAVCSMNAKTIEMVVERCKYDIQDISKQNIVVDGKITISLHDCQNDIYSYSIEWMSNYEVDLKANALLVLIMQQDVNILSPFVEFAYFEGNEQNTDSLYKSSTDDKSLQVSEFTPSCINSSEEIEQLVHSVLEEQVDLLICVDCSLVQLHLIRIHSFGILNYQMAFNFLLIQRIGMLMEVML